MLAVKLVPFRRYVRSVRMANESCVCQEIIGWFCIAFFLIVKSCLIILLDKCVILCVSLLYIRVCIFTSVLYKNRCEYEQTRRYTNS